MHVVWLGILFLFTWFCWGILGKPFPGIFWVAFSVPVIHQMFVWLTWRLELKSVYISRYFGFQAYLVVFFLLFISRYVSLSWLAWVDRDSLEMSSELRILLTLSFLLPGLYAMYSVKRYFGLSRAAGADHFDVNYQTMPLVREGIFRFTDNGMYLYAFLLFWAIAVYFSSIAALLVALVSHIYIWVHYYCTERPDMEYIYGKS